MNKLIIFTIAMLLSGCAFTANKTFKLKDGSTTRCLIAISDEGGVCWHGSLCTPAAQDPTECPTGGVM